MEVTKMLTSGFWQIVENMPQSEYGSVLCPVQVLWERMAKRAGPTVPLWRSHSPTVAVIILLIQTNERELNETRTTFVNNKEKNCCKETYDRLLWTCHEKSQYCCLESDIIQGYVNGSRDGTGRDFHDPTRPVTCRFDRPVDRPVDRRN